MDETLAYFYFEKFVFLIELIFMTISTSSEEAMGAEAIFWMYNSIVFAQSVIQTIFQCFILRRSIGELDGKDVNDKEEGSSFYVSKPKVLEPRRPEYLVGEKSAGGGASRRLSRRKGKSAAEKSQTKKGKSTAEKSQTKKGKSATEKSQTKREKSTVENARKGKNAKTHQLTTSRTLASTLPPIEEIDRRLIY